MSKFKLWNKYEIKARYIPTFISLIPIVNFLCLFLGKLFWKELSDNIAWMLIADLTLGIILMLTLVQMQCIFAKHWIEETVFGKGGERFPTTDMLLYNGGLISFERKKQLRDKISERFNCKFSTKIEENDNPVNARLQAREAVGQVRLAVGKGIRTLQYNIRYGFARNFIAGIVIWSTTGSIGCSVFYGIYNNWKPMVLFIIFSVTCFTIFFLKKMILKKLAFTYADTLFNEFLNQDKGDQ